MRVVALLAACAIAPAWQAAGADDAVDPDLRIHADAQLNALRARPGACDRSKAWPQAAESADAPDTPRPAALRWNPKLAQAAARKAGTLALTRHLAHVGPDGSTVRDRVRAVGYRWERIAETLIAGPAHLDEALASWLVRPQDCQTLLDPHFVEFGLARVEADHPTDAPRTYWVLVLGRPR